MIRIGKDANGVVMYVTDEELAQMKAGTLGLRGNNQQRAKLRKILNRM